MLVGVYMLVCVVGVCICWWVCVYTGRCVYMLVGGCIYLYVCVYAGRCVYILVGVCINY